MNIKIQKYLFIDSSNIILAFQVAQHTKDIEHLKTSGHLSLKSIDHQLLSMDGLLDIVTNLAEHSLENQQLLTQMVMSKFEQLYHDAVGHAVVQQIRSLDKAFNQNWLVILTYLHM